MSKKQAVRKKTKRYCACEKFKMDKEIFLVKLK